MEYKNRNEVPEEYKWDLTHRYKDFNEWDNDYRKLSEEVNTLKQYENKLFSSPKILFEALENKFDFEMRIMKLYCYTYLIFDQQLDDETSIAKKRLADNLFSQYASYVSYMEPEILDNSSKIERFIQAYSQLEKYNSYLKEIIRGKDHILSASEEAIISDLSSITNSFENTNSTLLNSEMDYGKVIDDGKEVEINSSNISKLLKSNNRELRKEVYYKVVKVREQYKTTLANQLISNMQFEHKIAKIRKFDDVTDMIFFNENIPIDVNKALYKVVNSRLDVFQKYIECLKKNLNIKDLKLYDLRVNPFKNEKEYSVKDMQKIILESLSILGSEYTDVLSKAFDERWIDYYGYKGKTAVTYCLSNYGDNPVIMAHLHGYMEDVSALAHELGHAVNSYLMFKNNHYHTADHENIIAEIASLTNEVLLTEYIINTTNDELEKKSYIYRMLDTIQNNLYDACLEGELENKSYKMLVNNESITAGVLTNMTSKLKEKYYGNTIELDEYSGYSWISRSHYFSPFYLYQYAVSISCACYIASKILNNEDDMLNKYLKFLTLGNTKNTVDTVKTLGIDLLSEEVYNKAIDYFGFLIEKL